MSDLPCSFFAMEPTSKSTLCTFTCRRQEYIIMLIFQRTFSDNKTPLHSRAVPCPVEGRSAGCTLYVSTMPIINCEFCKSLQTVFRLSSSRWTYIDQCNLTTHNGQSHTDALKSVAPFFESDIFSERIFLRIYLNCITCQIGCTRTESVEHCLRLGARRSFRCVTFGYWLWLRFRKSFVWDKNAKPTIECENNCSTELVSPYL